MKRWIIIVAMIALSLTLAACGGAAPAATTVPSGDNSSSAAAGSPADAVQAYFQAIYTGEGDVASMFCSAITDEQRAAINEGYEAMTSAFSAAGTEVAIDIAGLTFTAQDETADSANVVVGGSLSITVAGTAQEVPMTETTIPVRNENGWKICAAGS
jgi:ABC-type glycerol-3-phosphate transport system substrate-binding protein